MKAVCVFLAVLSSLSGETFSTDEAMVSFPPENVTIELGQNGTFSCNSTSPYIEWSLTESNNSKCQTIDVERTDKSLQSKQRLADRGIFITYYEVEDGLYSSEIIINGNLNNNFTRLDCNYAMAIGSKKCEDPGPAFLKVFEFPTTPENLQFSLQGSELSLSWSPSFSPFSVLITYQVEVKIDSDEGISINTSSTSVQVDGATLTEGVCSFANFSVQASNRAGESNLSIITPTLSSLSTTSYTHWQESRHCITDMLQVMKYNSRKSWRGIEIHALSTYEGPNRPNSLEHRIYLLSSGIEFGVTFKSLPDCLAVDYYLILHEIPSNQTAILGPFEQPEFTISSPSIRENSQYSYTVRAVNIINASSEAKHKNYFYTTDVQESRIIVKSSSISIQCSFISGSRCRGCYVLLEFDNSTQEHYIERSNGVADDVEKVVVISNQHALQNLSILVLDWEEDGALGNLSIPVRIHHPVDTTGLTESDGSSVPFLLIVVSAAGSIALAVLIAGIVLMSLYCHKRQKSKSRCHHQGISCGPAAYEVCQPGFQGNGVLNSDESKHVYYEIRNAGKDTTGTTTDNNLYSSIGTQRQDDTDSEGGNAVYSHLIHSLGHQTAVSCQEQNSTYAHIDKVRQYDILQKCRVPHSMPTPSPSPPPLPPLPPSSTAHLEADVIHTSPSQTSACQFECPTTLKINDIYTSRSITAV